MPTTIMPTVPPSTSIIARLDPKAGAYAGEVLLLTTLFIMVIMYLANSHIKYIREHTWSMLNLSVSIFCAVTWNNVLKYFIDYVLGIDTDADPPGFWNVFSSALILFCFWAFVAAVLFCFKSSKLRLAGYGTIGGHIMGFASITLWTDVCGLQPFRESPWWIVPVVLLLYLVTMVLFFASFGIMTSFCKKGIKKADADRWHDQAKDTGTDFFSLGMAFIFATWIKFLIWGQLDPALGDKHKDTPHQIEDITVLLAIGLFLLALSAMVSLLAHACPDSSVIDLVNTVIATCAAMCLLDVLNWWWLPGAPNEVLGRSYIAYTLTFIAIAVIIFFAVLSHCCMEKNMRAIRALFTGLGIAVGSSWEKTFDAAVDSLDELGFSPAGKAAMGFALFWIVFPAWMAYILPKGDDDLRGDIKGTPPVWAACCDFDPCPCDDSDADEYEVASGSDEDS